MENRIKGRNEINANNRQKQIKSDLNTVYLSHSYSVALLLPLGNALESLSLLRVSLLPPLLGFRFASALLAHSRSLTPRTAPEETT
jgi:hypothetical protein